MTKKDLCKYYHGEATFPESLLSKNQYAFLFWEAEKVFCDEDNDTEKEFIQIFLDAGLTVQSPSIPTSLVASIFVIYNKNSDYDLRTSAAYFRKNILPAYAGSTSM